MTALFGGVMEIVACWNCGTKNRVDERAAARSTPVCGKCGGPLGAGAAGTSTGGDTRRESAAGKPESVTDATFEASVLGARGVPVLVDFWAEWCGPCRMLAPHLDKVAAEQGEKLRVVKLNVDENPSMLQRFGIRGIPTMILFKGGEPVETLVGFMPKMQLLNKIQGHLDG